MISLKVAGYFSLDSEQRLQPSVCQGQHLANQMTLERPGFGGALQLNQPPFGGQYHVEVDIGGKVLFVAQVQQLLAFKHAATDGGHRAEQG